MKPVFPPQDLDCPDPAGCSVAIDELIARADAGALPTVTIPKIRYWYRVYDAQDGYAHPNPGFGDTRFAPFDAADTGERVPTLYVAESLEAALLETSLHNVPLAHPRVVDEMTLLGKLHAEVSPPHALTLIDLRDDRLRDLGLGRENLASSSSEHYPCTRRVARAIHAAAGARVNGIVWHSCQAELNSRPAAEVAVIFADRTPVHRGAWQLAAHRGSSGSLLDGSGRLWLDKLADRLDIVVETSTDLDA